MISNLNKHAPSPLANLHKEVSDEILLKSAHNIVQVFLVDIVQRNVVPPLTQPTPTEHIQLIDTSILRNDQFEIAVGSVCD